MKEPPAGSQAVIRALRVLKSLELGEASLDELATKVNLNKSTVHRILKTLIYENFVEQDGISRKYYLSYALVKLSVAARKQVSFRRQAIPVLNQLAKTTDETVHLSVVSGNEVICIEKVETDKPVRVHSEVGLSGPIYCTGSGKCLLAFMETKCRDEILDQIHLERHTSTTITNKKDLIQELERIRDQGVSYDIGEHQHEVMCVAAPIYDYSGNVVAAISIALPTDHSQQSRKNLKRLAPLVTAAAKEISLRIGFEA